MLLLIGVNENHPNGAIPRKKSIVRKFKKTYTFSQESEETVEMIDDGLQQPVIQDDGTYNLQPLSLTPPTHSSTPRINNHRTPIQSSAESSRGNRNVQPFTQLLTQDSPFGLNQHAPPIQEISVATNRPSDPRRRPRSQQESRRVSFDNHPPPNYQSEHQQGYHQSGYHHPPYCYQPPPHPPPNYYPHQPPYFNHPYQPYPPPPPPYNHHYQPPNNYHQQQQQQPIYQHRQQQQSTYQRSPRNNHHHHNSNSNQGPPRYRQYTSPNQFLEY